MPKPLSLPEKLDRFPPVVIRLLARKQRGRTVTAMSDQDIAAASGLSVGQVKSVSRLTNWGTVDVDTLQAFCKGCGADLDNRDWLRKNAAYMASIRSIPRYLRQSDHWSHTFEPLISIWVRHGQAKPNP